MKPLKTLLNLLPVGAQDDTDTDAQALLPSSEGLFLRPRQPLVFCGLRGPMRLQFAMLEPGQTRLVMRMRASAPVTLTGTLDYRAAMGSSLGRVPISLSATQVKALPEEEGLDHLHGGHSYRLSLELTPPDGTRAVVMQLDPPATGAEDVMLMMHAIRIQCPAKALGNPVPAHAVDAYAFVRDGGPALQIIAKLREAPLPDMAIGMLTLSDLIGTGPAVARMQRYDAGAAVLAPGESEARDRSGRAVLAVPRVRKLEAPGRSTKAFALGEVPPQTLALEVSMIQAGTEGYVNVLGTEVSYVRAQNAGFERMALEDIAADYYRAAITESDEALVKLRF